MSLKKELVAFLAIGCLVFTSAPAQANIVRQLTEEFLSGASFSGNLTFSDDASQLLSGTGTLIGGNPTPDSLNWIWFQGDSVARGGGVFSDFLMFGGAVCCGWNQFVEIAWTDLGGGNLALVEENLGSLDGGGDFANSIDFVDPMISGQFSNPNSVPEPISLGLVGLGLLGLVVIRRRHAA